MGAGGFFVDDTCTERAHSHYSYHHTIIEELSRVDRINLGLPISPKEFDTVNNEVTKRLIKTNHNS